MAFAVQLSRAVVVLTSPRCEEAICAAKHSRELSSMSHDLQALDALDLSENIEFILAGDDEVIAEGAHKPNPFPYLHAARLLGVEPESCLAFEDSLAGIRSAQAAAMRVVVVRNEQNSHLAVSNLPGPPPPLSPEDPLLPVAALIESFAELPSEIFD